MVLESKSNEDAPVVNSSPSTQNMVLDQKLNNDTQLADPFPSTQNMKLESQSNNGTPSSVNPPPSLLSPPMATSTSFYVNPQTTPLNYTFATPNNFGWTGNLPSFHPGYVGMSPIPQRGSSSNHAENVTMPLLHLGSYRSLPETHLTHNHPFLHFGSEMNQNENNTINSLLQLGSHSNRDLSKIKNILQLGSCATPPGDKRVSLELSLGLGKGNGSSSNRVDKNFTSCSNRVQKNENFESKFLGLALNPVDAVSQNEKNPNQLDQIQKGKSPVTVQSPVKAKGSVENNHDGEVDGGGDGNREEVQDQEEKVETERSEDEESVTQVMKTWNLRPRKPAKKDEKLSGGGGGRSRKGSARQRASRHRSAKDRVRPAVERPVVERRKFTLSLTKEEIEHDYILFTGEKPPKKPTKRPRPVQKNLDGLFPGMNLSTITPEMYAVDENAPLKR